MTIRGEFSDILSARTLAAMAERHPRFEQLTVKGQGHAPLLRDATTLGRILSFARRCHPSAQDAPD
jgi:pimeloyl-ACP methyl ester carboxylesterase